MRSIFEVSEIDSVRDPVGIPGTRYTLRVLEGDGYGQRPEVSIDGAVDPVTSEALSDAFQGEPISLSLARRVGEWLQARWLESGGATNRAAGG